MRFILGTCLLLAGSFGLQAGLVNSYSFTTDASDSVGGKNGTLIGTANIAGNAVQLDGSSTVSLPNGIMTGLNSFTIESWYTWSGSGVWPFLFDFGGTSSSYLLFTVNNGASFTPQFNITNSGPSGEQHLTSATAKAGGPSYAVITYDAPSTTANLYINTTLVATNTGITLKPSNLGSTTPNILGGAGFNGQIDEFRIYNTALSANEMLVNAIAGPNAVTTPEPATFGMIGMGLISIALVRRKSRA